MKDSPAAAQRPEQPQSLMIDSIDGDNAVALRAITTLETFHRSKAAKAVAYRQVLDVGSDQTILDDVLPRQQFMNQLRREKRRSERSKAPLSIVVFRPDPARRAIGSVQRLLRLLHDRKRETDILGYVESDLIAIILPETGQEGMNAFLRKLSRKVQELAFMTTSATYPDTLFESLTAPKPDSVQFEPMFLDRPKRDDRLGRLLKRSVDVTGAMLGIVVLSPVMLIAAAAIATTSPGPIVYKQVRLGKRGNPFVFYKFRSMMFKADDRIHREYVTKLIEVDSSQDGHPKTSQPWSKIQHDPRITRVGAFIRRTKIDELPQLFNVLKGDLSLVGPRPPLSYEVEKYQSWHLRRVLETKPGVTGLWQVEGGGHATFDDMVRMDLRYINRSSFLLDVKILLKTFNVILRRDNSG